MTAWFGRPRAYFFGPLGCSFDGWHCGPGGGSGAGTFEATNQHSSLRPPAINGMVLIARSLIFGMVFLSSQAWDPEASMKECRTNKKTYLSFLRAASARETDHPDVALLNGLRHIDSRGVPRQPRTFPKIDRVAAKRSSKRHDRQCAACEIQDSDVLLLEKHDLLPIRSPMRGDATLRQRLRLARPQRVKHDRAGEVVRTHSLHSHRPAIPAHDELPVRRPSRRGKENRQRLHSPPERKIEMHERRRGAIGLDDQSPSIGRCDRLVEVACAERL